VKSITVD